jgi:hypothetical protein
MELLGLSATTSTLAEGYLLFTSTESGKGLVNQPIQFHGAADVYNLKDASSLAVLYSTRTEATPNPAVTWRKKDKGQVAAFTFDLARSIVYTRQGNPAWEKQLRDRNFGCLSNGAQPCSNTVSPPIRSYNLFYGNAVLHPQNDWVDLNNFAIPQADEQQRFFANLIVRMNVHNKPLPRFWYFPHGKKAVVIMTGDGHEYSTPDLFFNTYKAKSPTGCSVADWECVRSTAYVYPRSSLTNLQAAAYQADGFEIAIHVNTGCTDWKTTGALRLVYLNQLVKWQLKYPSPLAPSTSRTHCVVWSDYATQPLIERDFGIRLDTTYYTYPDAWIKDRPGLLTGSGMLMRFAQKDGTMIDVYQANTQLHDDTPQTYPFWIDSLLDRAIGPEAYYGAFTTNIHVDAGSIKASELKSDAIVTSALSRGVPIVSAKQMLTWLDGRNAAAFKEIAWKENILSFTISAGAGANGIQAMLPSTAVNGPLVRIERNGAPIAFTMQAIKGIEYAFFSADAGDYSASYAKKE